MRKAILAALSILALSVALEVRAQFIIPPTGGGPPTVTVNQTLWGVVISSNLMVDGNLIVEGTITAGGFVGPGLGSATFNGGTVTGFTFFGSSVEFSSNVLIDGNLTVEGTSYLHAVNATNGVFTGTVTAADFVGNGSGLTGLPSGVCLAGTGGNSVLCQGASNTAAGSFSVESGGENNQAPGPFTTVGGGYANAAPIAPAIPGNAAYSTIGGGIGNHAQNFASAICGGSANTTGGEYSSVLGGATNVAEGTYSSIGGGLSNNAGGFAATVGGGQTNVAPGDYGTVPGGLNNTAQGPNTWAEGNGAHAISSGSYVWNSSSMVTTGVFDNGPFTFNVYAPGGIYLSSGVIHGDGSGLTGVGGSFAGGTVPNFTEFNSSVQFDSVIVSSSYQVAPFEYDGDQLSLGISAPPVLISSFEDGVYGQPTLSVYPRGLTAAGALSVSYSQAAELDFVGCDPTIDPNCTDTPTAGLATHNFSNVGPGFANGQAATSSATAYSLSLFSAGSNLLSYSVALTTDAANGPTLVAVDITTAATVFNVYAGSSLTVTGGGSTNLDGGLIFTDGFGDLVSLASIAGFSMQAKFFQDFGLAVFNSSVTIDGPTSLDNGAIVTDGLGDETLNSGQFAVSDNFSSGVGNNIYGGEFGPSVYEFVNITFVGTPDFDFSAYDVNAATGYDLVRFSTQAFAYSGNFPNDTGSVFFVDGSSGNVTMQNGTLNALEVITTGPIVTPTLVIGSGAVGWFYCSGSAGTLQDGTLSRGAGSTAAGSNCVGGTWTATSVSSQ